jgi:3-oxoadipate enol-lactonase
MESAAGSSTCASRLDPRDMPFATGSGGARIHYDLRGAAGPTAILVQGLGLSSRFWFDLPDRLAEGDDPWRVVTLDNRGVGRSDRPHWPPYTMGSLANDVASVLDHAGIAQAYVVGISLGGMVAQHVALRHPSRVAGLVLLATSAGFPHMRLPRAAALANFLALPFSGRLRPRGGVAESFARLLLAERDAARASELLADWPSALHAEPTSLRVYLSHFASMLGHSTGFRLKRITCPTVIVTGDDDSLMPLDNSRLLARLLPGAHLEIVPGGHIVPASDPECVRRALDRARAMAEDQMLSAPVRSR